MKLTLSWLREFVDVPVMELEELVDVFENLGHEVEEARILEPGSSPESWSDASSTFSRTRMQTRFD